MVQFLPVEREARGAIGHDTLALRGTDGGAQIGLARQTRRALPAFRRVERDDVVPFLDAGHARPDIDDDAGAFVAEDGREQTLGVGAGQRELVGVTDAGGFDLDQHFAGFRSLQLDLRDGERLALLQCDGGTGFHDGFPPRGLNRHEWKRSPQGKDHRRERGPANIATKLVALSQLPLSRPTMAIGRSFRHPGTKRVPSSEKNFKYRKKSITQRSLTEIEPSRKSAGRSASDDWPYGAAIRRCQAPLGG
jgi:hypothetical protein